MNTRFWLTFLLTSLIIVVIVVVILALILHVGRSSSPSAISTPVAAGVTVHNDTKNGVQVQDCTAALSACASSNAGTTRLAPGASGKERGATGLRILSGQGQVVGCIDLSGTGPGSTVAVSSASACPS